MRVLYLVPHEVFLRKMSRVRFAQMGALSDDVPVGMSGPGWPDWDMRIPPEENVRHVRVKGEPASVVITYQVENLAEVSVPVVTQFNEACDHDRVESFVTKNRVSLVVFHHANDLPHYGHWEARGIHRVAIHHCADPQVYRDYGLEKDIDVLVAGNLNDYYYPFRYRLMLLATRVLKKRGYRVVVLPHPGYLLPPREGTVVGEAFARMLNRAKLVVTCSMRYKYALAKYSEIALCKSLAVADCPDEREEFFNQTICHVEPWMLDEEIQRKMETLLDDQSGELVRLTAQAYDLTVRTSTMGQYGERLHAALGTLLAERRKSRG